MSGKQYIVRRKITDAAITAGGFITFDLPRDYDYAALMFRIEASVAVSVANATSVRAEAPAQLVNRVEIVADGKNTIHSVPFWAICQGNVDRLMTGSGGRAATPPSSPNIATYAVEAIGVIDCQNYDGIRPKDSNFRSRGLSLLQCRLTFGNAADIFVVGGATVAYSGSPIVSVWAVQCVEEMDDKGGYLSSPIALKKTSYQEIPYASSNANAEVLLPAGNAIQRVLLRTEGITTAGEPGVGVLNNAQLAAGMDVRVNNSGKNIRANNNADYGQTQAGYYVLDPTKLGCGGNNKLTDLWDVSNVPQPKAILDVTGGANVRVQAVITEYIMRGA